MRILDLHQIPRTSYHVAVCNVHRIWKHYKSCLQVLDKLRSRLIARCRELCESTTHKGDGMQKVTELLEQSFKMRNVPQLRPVVLEVLRLADNIDER
jgi:hypothetical protein